MEAILRFFVTYSSLIYLALAVGALWSGGRLVKALRNGSAAVFGLEREVNQGRVNSAVAALTVIFLLAVAELVLTSFLMPMLPGFSFLSTATLNLVAVPTGTLPPEIATSLGMVTPQVSPSAEASGCIPGQIMLTYPEPGDTVKGSITLTGIIDVPNFGFFKYEYAHQGLNGWTTLQAGREVGEDGRLGEWDTSLLTPGDYLLRLVVADNAGKEYPPCVVPVRVVAP